MELPPKQQVLTVSIGAIAVLVLLHILSTTVLVDYSWTVARWFNLDAEGNIPTWFSSLQLSLVAALALANWSTCSGKDLRRAYLVLSAALLFLSADEAASIHEGVTQIFKALGVDSSRAYLPGVWTLIYPVAGLAIAALFWPAVRAFLGERPGLYVFLWGVALFVTGSLMLEVAAYVIVPVTGADSVYTYLEVCLEEACEMLGASLMVYALLAKLEARALGHGSTA